MPVKALRFLLSQWATLITIVFLSTFHISCDVLTAVSAPRIVVIGDMTNNLSGFGPTFLDGVLVGINNKIDIVQLNDKDDIELARKYAYTICQDPRVVLVIGHSSSNTTIAASHIYARSGIPLLAPVATMDNLYPSVKDLDLATFTAFRLPPSNKLQAKVVVKHLHPSPTSKALIVYVNDGAYSSDMAERIATEWPSSKFVKKLNLNSLKAKDRATLDNDVLTRKIASLLNDLYVDSLNINNNATNGVIEDNREVYNIIITTFHENASLTIESVKSLPHNLPYTINILCTDGACNPIIGKGGMMKLIGVEFVFVGPSWQSFDGELEIRKEMKEYFKKNKSITPYSDEFSREPLYSGQWPSFFVYGYMAAKIVDIIVDRYEPLTRSVIMEKLESCEFNINMKYMSNIKFMPISMGGVREPSDYVITIYKVISVSSSDLPSGDVLKEVTSYKMEDIG